MDARNAPGIMANWEAPSGQEWRVAVGGGISKVTGIGKQPIQRGMFDDHNAFKPDVSVFRVFTIERGTVAWPNWADIAPETLHAAPDVEAAA